MKTRTQVARSISKYFQLMAILEVILLSGCGEDEPTLSPVIEPQRFNVSEHSETGTSVGFITATDPEGADLVFSISSGNGRKYFELDQSSGELTVGQGEINFEKLSSHELGVSVSDGKKNVEALISISVDDIDECEAGLCPNYLDIIYTENEISVTSGLSYGSHHDLKFDFYSVESNPDPERPLVIVFPWCQIDNPKSSVAALQGHAKFLAQRGYVVALAYERESVGGDTFKEDIVFYMRQVHDHKAAIRHFKKEAQQYGLDTMNFFLSGWSLGSIAALLTAQLELDDIEQMVDGGAEFQEVFDDIGFEGTENLGFSSDIRGVTMMTIFASDLAIIDAGGPAMMIIHNENTTLSDGTTLVMGEIPYNNGVYSTTVYGPDMIKNHAIAEGYIEGDELGYILMDEGTNDPNFNPIVSTLTSDNWNKIAEFYYKNLDR